MIPSFQKIMLPLLELLKDHKPRRMTNCAEELAKTFNLTDQEKKERVPSGGFRFLNRVCWARLPLSTAGLLKSPQRGLWEITQEGLDLLAENPAEITVKLLKEKYPDCWVSDEEQLSDTNETDVVLERTPEEQMQILYEEWHAVLCQEILSTIMDCSPEYFERLVVDVLVAMGYGGSKEDAGQAIGGVNDEGIDGVIKEDALGLDVIYLQAKRWQGDIGRPEIQKFAGALQGKKAKKGVFITTSSFSKNAKEWVKGLDSKIILIDGMELVKLMVDYDVGVSEEGVYKLKRIDRDYFEEE